MKLTGVLLMALTLVGCAKGVDELAKEGSWQQIGYQDGVRGQLPRSYSALQELGAANQAEYENGYHRGITEFCDADYAFQIGLSGQNYNGSCEGLPESQRFRMEWQRGWNEYNSH